MPFPAGGGSYSYRQLESLWLSAGGNKALAPIMAAIAMAESGGNPDAVNDTSGATGLWQIDGAVHPADQSRLKDPSVNAREAVAKYHTQGLDAWTTWTSGAYKKFIQGNVAARAPVTGGQAFIDEAKKFQGDPYVWGGESPKGFDCSGLVQYVSQKLGLKGVPRTSEAQWAYVEHIDRAQLKPGDLVFYAGSDGTDTAPGHVAIYQGGGKIFQAEQTGTRVGTFPMDSAGTPVGYGRIPGINQATFTGATGGGGGSGGPDWSGWLQDLGNGLAALNAGASPTNFLESLTGSLPSPVSGVTGPLTGIAETLYNAEQHIAWFFQPNHWVRLICGAAGTVFVALGIFAISRTGHAYSVSNPLAGASVAGVSLPSQMPAAGGQLAPALGIAEITAGAILLFVAFHNLPPTVTDFGGLVSYLQGQLQTGGKAG